MDVLMPQLGETVAEGKITKWFVAPGAAVKPETTFSRSKPIRCRWKCRRSSGVLTEIRIPAGAVAPVGAVVAIIGSAGAAVTPRAAVLTAPPPKAAAPAPSAHRPQLYPDCGAPRRAHKLDPFFSAHADA
jgi:pyruvate/2-oxoglutarate dehydrogenase complex dihydrolipoamide acyltransferase (E2) component